MKSTILLIVISVWSCRGQRNDGPSDTSEFLTQPSNITVPEGEPVILKCMAASKAQLCRWYFLELGLKFFDKRITPMLVKEFKPEDHQDCSIKIAKVKKVQEGQWLCQSLKLMTSKFIMSKPATVRVITETESATWEPELEPRNGRREDDINNEGESTTDNVEFEISDDDIIQDVFIQENAVLKCQVNQPITSCSWSIPGDKNLSSTEDTDNSNKEYNLDGSYKIIGNISEGNCSLEITEVDYHNEGNWRCTVRTANDKPEVQGPLLHLHILDHNTAPLHTHDTALLSDEKDDSVNLLVISLVTISGILFVIVLLLLMFLYRRLKGTSDETQRILQNSPRNSMDLQRKRIPVTDLTSASVMAVEPRKKFIDDHYGHYNQYIDMTGSGSHSGDGYIIMPGSSIRSSTSSRTTLSTLSTLPAGRSRSASNSTTDSAMFPHLTTIIDNPSYNPDIDSHLKRISRTDSVYSNDHVYEEIKEKIDEIVGKMEKIPEADSPTYINTTEDYNGYAIPKTSPTNSPAKDQQDKELLIHITKTPLPEPRVIINENEELEPLPSEAPPPYSRVSSEGLVPVIPTPDAPSQLDPGYSRVGNETQINSDLNERYATPRPAIAVNPLDSYDVPRQIPSPVNPLTTSPIEHETPADGLIGIIV